jgi:hypothetical protein
MEEYEVISISIGFEQNLLLHDWKRMPFVGIDGYC